MSKVTIDVVLATKDPEIERFIRAVRSVAQQQVNAELKLIVIFDQCRDSTIEQCRGVLDTLELQVVTAKVKYSSLTRSLAYGCDASTADFIARIDDDDEWLLGKLQKQLDAALTHNAVLVGTSYKTFLGEHTLVHSSTKTGVITHQDFCSSNPIGHSSALFKRSDYITAGGYDPQCLVSQDYDLWERLLRKGGTGYIVPECLTHRWVTDKSVSRDKRHLQRMVSLKVMLRFAKRGTINRQSVVAITRCVVGIAFHLLKKKLVNLLNGLFDTLFDRYDYWHGDQSVGERYSLKALRGYYNDLQKKVKHLNDFGDIPTLHVKDKGRVLHPVTVCQVGLGAYDNALITNCDSKKRLAVDCAMSLAETLVKDQEIKVPYSFKLFQQKEGFQSGIIYAQTASLLMRVSSSGYTNSCFDEQIKLCIDKLLSPIEDGGCFNADWNLIEEYLPESRGEKNAVLNGWIAGIWALYDAHMYFGEPRYRLAFLDQISSLEELLPLYDCEGWSRYNLFQRDFYSNIASPYYHREHLAQLSVLFEMTKSNVIFKYHQKFLKSYRERYRYFFRMAGKGVYVIMQRILKMRS